MIHYHVRDAKGFVSGERLKSLQLRRERCMEEVEALLDEEMITLAQSPKEAEAVRILGQRILANQKPGNFSYTAFNAWRDEFNSRPWWTRMWWAITKLKGREKL